jgi:hypothetical protein
VALRFLRTYTGVFRAFPCLLGPPLELLFGVVGLFPAFLHIHRLLRAVAVRGHWRGNERGRGERRERGMRGRIKTGVNKKEQQYKGEGSRETKREMGETGKCVCDRSAERESG